MESVRTEGSAIEGLLVEPQPLVRNDVLYTWVADQEGEPHYPNVLNRSVLPALGHCRGIHCHEPQHLLLQLRVHLIRDGHNMWK